MAMPGVNQPAGMQRADRSAVADGLNWIDEDWAKEDWTKDARHDNTPQFAFIARGLALAALLISIAPAAAR